jgi:hypothetical protein
MYTRRRIIHCFSFFAVTSAGYLSYDLNCTPIQKDIPLHPKKIFYLSDRIYKTVRFTPAELQGKELKIRNGYLYESDSDIPLHGDDWIYIMDANQKIFIARQCRRKVNHLSIGHACMVLAAGELKVRNGKLYELNENSGHYRPKDRLSLVEDRIKMLGAEFSPEYISKNYKFRPMMNNRN